MTKDEKTRTHIRMIGEVKERDSVYEGVTIEEACKKFADHHFRTHPNNEGVCFVTARRFENGRELVYGPFSVLRKEMLVVEGLRGVDTDDPIS